jgi:hypothetical protein
VGGIKINFFLFSSFTITDLLYNSQSRRINLKKNSNSFINFPTTADLIKDTSKAEFSEVEL